MSLLQTEKHPKNIPKGKERGKETKTTRCKKNRKRALSLFSFAFLTSSSLPFCLLLLLLLYSDLFLLNALSAISPSFAGPLGEMHEWKKKDRIIKRAPASSIYA